MSNFLLDSINMQIEKIKAKFKHADEGEIIVSSHFSYEFSPFNILPLKHWKLHAEAEIKWLELFKDMIESINDFKGNFQKYIEKSQKISQKKR